MLKEYDYMKKEIKNFSLLKTLFYSWNNDTVLVEVQKNRESKKSKSCKQKNGRIMLLSKCVVCDGKKSKFIKKERKTEQEASGILASVGIKTPLSKVSLLGPLLF